MYFACLLSQARQRALQFAQQCKEQQGFSNRFQMSMVSPKTIAYQNEEGDSQEGTHMARRQAEKEEAASQRNTEEEDQAVVMANEEEEVSNATYEEVDAPMCPLSLSLTYEEVGAPMCPPNPNPNL